MADLSERMRQLVDRACANNEWRQRRCFNLIPSEMSPSLLVRMLEIGDPAGRYAEHRTQKGREVYYYQGTEFIREVENECCEEMKQYFGCADVELRPISGQMSNEIVFKAMLKFLSKRRGGQQRMNRVVNNDLNKGGHLSAQPMGALFNFVTADPETGADQVTNFPISTQNPYRPDVPAVLETVAAVKPDLVIFGKSMFLYPEPLKEVAGLVADWDEPPVLMYDMAHVLGLYGAFQTPFEDGANVVTGSTHKTFFGPQRGVVAGNLPKGHPYRKLWVEIKSRAFPGSTSNHHLGTLLGLLGASYEMNAFKSEYQDQVRRNAKAFATALDRAGVAVEGNAADGFTETHQVICRVRDHGIGEEIAERLERNNIIVNYQALPDDPSFNESSGIRIGVSEMTRFGMQEADFEPLATFMADVIVHDKSVGEEVSRARARFLDMRYCVPEAEAAVLGAKLLTSTFPRDDHVKAFADAMSSAFARS